MKRIASLALSAALLASLSTPVLAAPAISVDAAPTAAVLEEENSLWELPQADTPDMSNTVWSFAGGYIDGGEMTQAEMDESLAAYGGTLQFTTNGEYPWFPPLYEGRSYAVSGNATQNDTISSISTTVTVEAGATLFFDWDVCCEKIYDNLYFLVDGKLRLVLGTKRSAAEK